MLPDRRRRRPVCRMLIVDILEHRGLRESLSVVDGVLRCCRSAGTVQTRMAVPCRVDTCRPRRRVWTWRARGRRANEGRYDECLSAHGRTCECQIQLAPPHSLRAVACPSTLSLSQREDSCSSQPDCQRRRKPRHFPPLESVRIRTNLVGRLGSGVRVYATVHNTHHLKLQRLCAL